MSKLIIDIICIILLLLIPEFILEKTGLLRSIEILVAEKMEVEHDNQ